MKAKLQDTVAEYLMIGATIDFFEADENDKYADEVDYWSGFSQDLHDRKNDLQQEIIKSHPYFKKNGEHACFSMDDEDLIKPFAKGKCRLVYDGGWGTPCESRVVTNPTGLDMYALADQLVRMSGDRHHVFVESMDYKRTVKGVKEFEMWCGS